MYVNRRDKELTEELVKLARAGFDTVLEDSNRKLPALFQLIGDIRPDFGKADKDTDLRCLKDVIGRAIEMLPNGANIRYAPFTLRHAAKILFSFEEIDVHLDRRLEDDGIYRAYDRRVSALRRECPGVDDRTFERYVTGKVRSELVRALTQLELEPIPVQQRPFVARPALEKWYKELPEKNRRVVGLYGEPGTGKTWLAHHLAEDSGKTIFLDGHCRDSILRDASGNLPTLALREGYEHVGLTFSRWLVEAAAPPGTVIVDNASDWDIVSLVLPAQPAANLRTNYLITSNRLIVPLRQGVSREVGNMETAEAVRMTRVRLPALEDREAEALVGAVERRPLAIEHACALLEVYGDFSVSDLIAEMEDDIVDFFYAGPSERKLSKLYHALLRKIEEDENHPLAWRLLSIYAFLNDEATLDVVAAAWAAANSIPKRRTLLQRQPSRRIAFDTAISELSQFSLLRKEGDRACPALVMHQLTYKLINGLRSRADEITPCFILDVALMQIKNDDWTGGEPVSHNLHHWSNPVAQSIELLKEDIKDGIPTEQLLVLKAYLLSGGRDAGAVDTDSLESYIELHCRAFGAETTDTAITAARESLAIELVVSGSLHSRAISRKHREQIAEDVPEPHIYDPYLGDFFFPVSQDTRTPGGTLSIDRVEREISCSDHEVESARWHLVAGALHYGQAAWAEAHDAYDSCFQLGKKSGALAGYSVALRAATHAVELMIREGLCHQADELWLRRIEALQTDDLWLRLHSPDAISTPRLPRMHADLRLAILFSEMPSLGKGDTAAEVEQLTEEYLRLTTEYPQYLLPGLRAPALYQLGRVYTYRGKYQDARKAFSDARDYMARTAHPSDFGVALCDLALLKLKLRALPKGLTRITRLKRAVAMAHANASETFVKRYGSRYWQSDALLTVWTFMRVLYGYDKDRIAKLESLARSACQAIDRPDKFEAVKTISRENLDPTLLFID
jgi:hypothetical protein